MYIMSSHCRSRTSTSTDFGMDRVTCLPYAYVGMVVGMATQKITVTLQVEHVQAIRDLVADGKADSVSGFVQNAVRVSLDDVAGWGAMLAAALRSTGGEMTPDERVWADNALGTSSSSVA